MRRSSPFLPALVVLATSLLLAACSQEKDAFLNRTFHRLTARDNGWFNANEKLKELVMDMEDAHVDDYDQVLPLFIYGTEQQSRAAVPDLEKCIDKCSLVIERHSMDIKGKEKNAWIDDAWFVIAKSQFYKRNYSEAERGFTYITRRFKGGNREMESEIWLARTAIELEQYAKAQSALDHVRDAKNLPKRFDQGELAAVQADLELKRGKVDDAILHLERAVTLAKRKRERVRWAFILGQLYDLKGQQAKAINQFAAVVKMNPPYEIAFHAQIFQALAYNKGDTKSIRKKLNAMLRDDKHVDHFDMIHYALADLDLKERKDSSAIDHLTTSVRVSTTDTRQKAKSFLKLADIYFDDRDYVPAQQYYDSTRTLLSESHVRFDEVDTRARVLGDLVEQLNIIEHEDSLQMLMGLDPEELEKKVRGIIRAREEAEEETRRREEAARDLAEQAPPPPPPGTGGRGNWYFYDPQQLGRGLANFRKRWGNRPLEDDWRRKDRSGSANAMNTEEEEEEEETTKGEEGKEPEWKKPEFYMRDIPKDDAALAASNARVCAALYISGVIYKEELRDVDNAIESFEVLNNRFEECEYTAEAHYQLYRIYLEKERTGWFSLDGIGSQTYADIILARWPDSEFARLVLDPNILQADEMRKKEEEAAYKEVYLLYRQYAYFPVIAACDRVIADEPSNHFRAKYHLLRAMSIGGNRDLAGFRAALTELRKRFTGTEEAQRAEELLASLDGVAPIPRNSAPSPAAFSTKDGAHYYMVVIPNEGNDVTEIRTMISNFDQTYFLSMTLEVNASFIDPQNQAVLVSPIPNKSKALEYHGQFMGNEDMLQGINNMGYPCFAISVENYTALFKSKDINGYQAFFEQHYLDGQ